MKQYFGVALGMVAGSVLGAAAVTGLNAQVKAPAVYLVTEIDVTNPDAYGKEFAPKAQATIRAAGGRLVAIGGAGGAGATPVAAIEGTPEGRFNWRPSSIFKHEMSNLVIGPHVRISGMTVERSRRDIRGAVRSRSFSQSC
jgi:hypothetical protein